MTEEMMVKELEKRDKAALQEVLGTKEGRWFFMRLLEHCHYSQRLAGNDPVVMARFEGQRDIAVDLINSIDALGMAGVHSRQKAEQEYFEFYELIEKLKEE